MTAFILTKTEDASSDSPFEAHRLGLEHFEMAMPVVALRVHRPEVQS